RHAHTRRGSPFRPSQGEQPGDSWARSVVLLDEDASILPIESLMQPCSLPGGDDAIRLKLAFHGADPQLASNQLPRLIEAETTVLDAVVDAMGLSMLALIYPRCPREGRRGSEHQRHSG